MTPSSPGEGKHTTPLYRITEGRHRWRVLVETWPDTGVYHGRLLFRPDGFVRGDEERESAPLLHGRSREDVVSLAYDMPPDRLRRVFYSS